MYTHTIYIYIYTEARRIECRSRGQIPNKQNTAKSKRSAGQPDNYIYIYIYIYILITIIVNSSCY